MGDHDAPESVIRIDRKERSRSAGTSDQDASEPARILVPSPGPPSRMSPGARRSVRVHEFPRRARSNNAGCRHAPTSDCWRTWGTNVYRRFRTAGAGRLYAIFMSRGGPPGPMADCWITRRGCTLAWSQTQGRRLAPAARGGIPVPTRIPASERTSQKLDELLTQGVADGDARTELLKLAVRKIVEEALEAEVAEAVGRGYYDEWRRAGRRLSERLSAEPAADGGGRDRVRRAAGGRSARAVRVAGARRAGGPHGRAGAPGRRDVRPRAEHARHRGRLPRRHRRHDAEPHGGEPGHRAPVAGVRSLRHPRSE